jgi:hypothetical protein
MPSCNNGEMSAIGTVPTRLTWARLTKIGIECAHQESDGDTVRAVKSDRDR